VISLIPHNHPFRIAWNVLVLADILAFVFLITYRIVFREFAPDPFYYLMTAIFVADLLMGFVTKVKSGHVRLDTPAQVSRSYLRGWFAVDALAALPIELIIALVLGASTLGAQVLGGAAQRVPIVLQALTLVKVLKAARIFSELEEALGIIPAVKRLVAFVFWFSIGLHLMALGWILIGASEAQRAPFDQYLRALYWVTTTIATIGYGDYVPSHDSNLQITYTIVVQLFGVTMYSFVIANVSSLVQNMDVARSAYRRRLDEVNAYLRAHRIPADLQERVRDYFSYLWEKQRGVSATAVLDVLPRSLSQEILLFLNKDVVNRVELFKDADELFIREAVQLLRPRVFLPGEHIIRQGEFGDCMYFLTGGEVLVSVSGKDVARLGPGSPFGETALVENLHRNASVVSVSFSTGYQLSKRDFDELRSKYPDFDRQVKAVVEHRRKGPSV
jgi:hypothetical protein